MLPEAVARHGAAALGVPFLAFLCACAVLRARERRRESTPCWTGPISLAWAATLGLTALQTLLISAGLSLQRSPQLPIPSRGFHTLEADRSLGDGILQVSALLFPGFILIAWIGLGREARRRGSPPGRHSPFALAGLLLSGGALAIFFGLHGADLK